MGERNESENGCGRPTFQTRESIRESRWKVEHKFDVNHTKKSLDRFHERFPIEEGQHLYGFGQRLKNGFNTGFHRPIPWEKRIEAWKRPMTIIVATTADVPIPRTRVVNGDSVITLEQERLCGGTSLRDRKLFKRSIH
jgi:uncharacterized protein YneR